MRLALEYSGALTVTFSSSELYALPVRIWEMTASTSTGELRGA